MSDLPIRRNTFVPVVFPVTVKLRAWHEPAGILATRNLGLADVAIGEREQSAELMDEGAGKLIAAMKELPPDPVLLTK